MLVNHHYSLPQQRYALDLVKIEHGRTGQGESSDLVSFTTFGELLPAPTDGTVVWSGPTTPTTADGFLAQFLAK